MESWPDDGFAYVRLWFDMCRSPAVRPFLSDEVLEQVSSPRYLDTPEGTREWGIPLDSLPAVLHALVQAKQSGKLPTCYWEAARKARLWLADIERAGGWEAKKRQAFHE
jgi:hypothetical protein